MEILYFDTIPSTQIYLTEKIRKEEILSPVAVIADFQTDGIGSRGNRWMGQRGNFFASLALDKDYIPDDLPIVSASLYFAYIMKSVLVEYNQNTWIKFQNGEASGFELTQAQNQYLEKQASYYQAVMEFINAKIELQKLNSTLYNN